MPCRHLAYSPFGDPEGQMPTPAIPGPGSPVPGIKAKFVGCRTGPISTATWTRGLATDSIVDVSHSIR
jgi:hypothetical protein